MTPGTHPNGLFWTTEIPRGSFDVSNNGKRARLRLKGQPLVDSIAFGAPFGISSIADIDITWRVDGPFEDRGQGSAVDPTDPAAFEGSIAPARATGKVSATRTGFSFTATGLTSAGFYAQLGTQANGVFLA